MSAASNLLVAISLIFLAHAGYSAYEFSHYLKHVKVVSSATLPIDIMVEAIVATVLFSLGMVLTAPSLQPVAFAKWTKAMEHEGRNPYIFLETKPGFADITGLRKLVTEDKTSSVQ
ncbi:magnesium transporter [Dipodascopsis uninucleata]